MEDWHFMIDLETMSTRPNAAIIEIAAVRFACRDGLVTESSTFAEQVTLQSSVAHGLHFCPETVEWWQGQSVEATALLTDCAAIPLRFALERLEKWMAGCHRSVVWSNGASFDLPILASAFRAVGRRQPWEYRQERCYRTVIALAQHLGWERPKMAFRVAHRGEADAVHQASLLASALGFLEGLKKS